MKSIKDSKELAALIGMGVMTVLITIVGLIDCLI